MSTTRFARKSTNEKLASIINGKETGDHEDALYKQREAAAKVRMMRAAFYGYGARAIVPKTKIHETTDFIPDVSLMKSISDAESFHKIKSSVPPGAHQDQYRLVQYSTEKCKSDPDRIFYTTTTFTEGIEYMPQCPWYYGYNNKTKPSENLLSAANRYGFRGSQEIRQKHTLFVAPPSKTRNAHTPKFLSGNDALNEWVPPILAATYQTVNNYESPKLWPENANYPSGYVHKQSRPSLVTYNRETTIGSRPTSSDRLDKWFNVTNRADESLAHFSKMENNRDILSPTMAARVTFEETWKNRLATSASSLVKERSLGKEQYMTDTVFENLSLSDPSDVLKYSGKTALIVHSQNTEELKFRLQLQQTRSRSHIPYSQKWTRVSALLRSLQKFTKKGLAISAIIKEMTMALRRQAQESESSTKLSRPQFMAALQKMRYFRENTIVGGQLLAGIYSAFDPLKRGYFRYVELVVALTLLDDPEGLPLEKLSKVWVLLAEMGNDQPPLEAAREAFLSCSISEEDRREVLQVYKTLFRSICYRLAINGPQSSDFLKLRISSPTMRSISEMQHLRSPDSKDGECEGGDNSSTGGPDSPERGLAKRPYINIASGAYQKNICDEFFSLDSFLTATNECPDILNIFALQLNMRLREHAGEKGRVTACTGTPKEEMKPEKVAKDFKWILHKGLQTKYNIDNTL